MARFEDDCGPFGGSCGGTAGEITCCICGKIHHEGADENEDNFEFVRHVAFGEGNLCECCFEVMENFVFRHMSSIIPWYQRILDAKRNELNRAQIPLDSLLGTQ